MSGYTVEGFDNLLDKLMDKMKNITDQMRNTNILHEEYKKLADEYERLSGEYAIVLDLRMDLYMKDIEIRNTRWN